MVPRPDREGIRPTLKLVAAALLSGAALAVYLLLSPGGAVEARGGARAAWAGGEEPGWDPSPSARRRHWTGQRWSSGGWEGSTELAVERRDEEDPQILAMQRSHGGADSGVTPAFWPTTRRARLERVAGHVPLEVGAECEVRVLPVLTGGFNCLVKVSCDGTVLYPEPGLRAGYVACNLHDGVPSRAVDSKVTHDDGDPTVDVDMVAGKVTVSDQLADGRSFVAELQVLNPYPRRM